MLGYNVLQPASQCDFYSIHLAKHAEIPTVSTSTGLANDITEGRSFTTSCDQHKPSNAPRQK